MLDAIRNDAAPAVWQQTRYDAPSPAPRADSGEAFGVTPLSRPLPYERQLPEISDGYAPAELATRARTLFPDLGTPLSNALEGKLAGLENELSQDGVPGVEDAKSAAETSADAKCETCAKRKYQDGSDDPGVSFKMPTNVDPKMAASAVRGHEQEHVTRERAAAEREGRKVVSQTVTYHTGICPECGKFYVSGGTTRTVTAADNSGDSSGEAQGREQDD